MDEVVKFEAGLQAGVYGNGVLEFEGKEGAYVDVDEHIEGAAV